MRLYGAKLLTVVCEELAEGRVVEILERHGATGHTVTEVRGRGSRGIRGGGRGRNSRVEAVMGAGPAQDAVEEISRTMFADYALVLYVSDVGVVRGDRF